MSDANKVALRSFLTTRRGGRVLQDDIQVSLHTYFVAKNRPLRELTTEPPEDAEELASLVAEWRLYAEAATLDAPDVHIVAEWVKKADGGARRAERGGKAVAVADALAAAGVTIDRDVERVIAKTLIEHEHGELRSQCRMVDVIWIIYLGQLPGVEERLWFEDKRHGSSMRMVVALHRCVPGRRRRDLQRRPRLAG